MSIKHKWPGWFVLAVLLFCCADLKAVDKEGFATDKEDLPTELQKYTKISNGKITFSVGENEQIVSMELYYQEKFSFTAIRPSSTSNECTAMFKFEKGCSVGWLGIFFRFDEASLVTEKDVKVDIKGTNIWMNGIPKEDIHCRLKSETSDDHGLFKNKVNIAISEVKCDTDIAFAFDSSKFKLLATTTTTTTTPPPPPTIEEFTATTKKEGSESAPNEGENYSTVPVLKSSVGESMAAWVWVIIGIAVCLVLVLVPAFLIWCFCFKKKNGSGEQNKKGHNSSLDGVMHGSSRVRLGTEYSQRTYDTKPETDEPIESNEPSKEDMGKNKKPTPEPIGKSGRLQKKASEPVKKQKSAPVKKIVETEQIPGLAAEQVQQERMRDRDQDNDKPKSDHVYEVIGAM